MRYVPLFFVFVFIAFAWLQLNDPDPLVWTLTYLCAALLCFIAYTGKLVLYVALGSAVLFVAGAVYQWPPQFDGISGNMDLDANIELARESLGLFICAVATMISYVVSARLAKSANG